MTHAASLAVLTQRWVMSHLTRAQCGPESVWVIAERGERERYPDTENQSRVVRTGTRRPGTNPCLDTQGLSWWRPGPAGVMLRSYQLLKYFTFQMRLSSQIAALASQSYRPVFSVRRTFLLSDWVTITVPITCSLSPGPGHDGVWCVVTGPHVTTCTCHVCHQALSPALADNISTAHNILFSCSLIPWCSWLWHPGGSLALTSRPSLE